MGIRYYILLSAFAGATICYAIVAFVLRYGFIDGIAPALIVLIALVGLGYLYQRK